MTHTELEEAVFWDQLVCLDCGAVHNPPEGSPPGDLPGFACPACGSDAIYTAALLSRISDFLGEDEEA